MVISGIEAVFGIVLLVMFLSPRITESRVRRVLHLLCCCVIRDDEVIDSLVSGIMKLPSFDNFSMTDIIAGLLMTNMVYHDKKKTIAAISDPQERLQVKTMRVHEYIKYLKKNSDRFHLSAEAISRASLGRHSTLLNLHRARSVSSRHSETEEIVHDEDGQECTVLSCKKEDDIFDSFDIEYGIGSEVMRRLQYGIDKERLTVFLGIESNWIVFSSYVSVCKCCIWIIFVSKPFQESLTRVWLNSYMEKNTRALMREVNKNLRQTKLKDYNQLKVRIVSLVEYQITLQSLLNDFGGQLIYCTDANVYE